MQNNLYINFIFREIFQILFLFFGVTADILLLKKYKKSTCKNVLYLYFHIRKYNF